MEHPVTLPLRSLIRHFRMPLVQKDIKDLHLWVWIKSRDCLVAIHQPAKLTVSYILTDLIDPLFKGLNLVSLSWILWNFSDLSFGLKGVACLGYLDFLILILVCYHG